MREVGSRHNELGLITSFQVKKLYRDARQEVGVYHATGVQYFELVRKDLLRTTYCVSFVAVATYCVFKGFTAAYKNALSVTREIIPIID